jgi:two-component system, sporulation sensor kinase D
MNLYSKKQRWKIVLLLAALLIASGTIWYTSYIASKVQKEERQKVKLWSEAIRKKADLVKLTNQSFSALAEEERKKVELHVKATKEMDKDLSDYTFPLNIIQSNTTIPLILVDDKGYISSSVNIENDHPDTLQKYLQDWAADSNFIEVKNQKIHYRNSDSFYDLQVKRDSLIASFNNDLVDNSALVPVIFIDANSKELIATNIEDVELTTTEQIEKQIALMESENLPIEIKLDEDNTGEIYFQESLTLKQLRYFPYIMLSIITLFLFVGYLLFSTFRRAEQNQVWVGMAKETAHQLGTPLSSLMAWLEILKSQGVEESSLVEMNKDIVRLETVSDRFSKIGSASKKEEANVYEIINHSVDYLKSRVSKKVKISIQCDDKTIYSLLNISLFEWVIENLTKNAVDAMAGEGNVNYKIFKENQSVIIEVSDTGKGIPLSKLKTVFEPGYTTKKRGWGLGLSLVKRIIEEHHNGKVTVKHSQIDKGTTFRIVL